MDEELNLDLNPEQEEINREKTRNKGLSEKVIQASKERDEAKALAEKNEAEKAAALKDVDFYKNFTTEASQYQGALEYQDKVKEKFNKGYAMKDAIITTLNDEGKYTPPVVTPPVSPRQSPTGGSAPTTLKSGEKPVSEMTLSEKRAELVEAERRGDLGLN